MLFEARHELRLKFISYILLDLCKQYGMSSPKHCLIKIAMLLLLSCHYVSFSKHLSEEKQLETADSAGSKLDLGLNLHACTHEVSLLQRYQFSSL